MLKSPGPLGVTSATTREEGTRCRPISGPPGTISYHSTIRRAALDNTLEDDASNLCIAASASGFIHEPTQAVIDQTSSVMRAAPVHRVATVSEFESLVREFRTGVFLAVQDEHKLFNERHRAYFNVYGVTGQTVRDVVVGVTHIVIVGEFTLVINKILVERHERGHVGLEALGVPTDQHNRILDTVGLGEDQLRHLGAGVDLSEHQVY